MNSVQAANLYGYLRGAFASETTAYLQSVPAPSRRCQQSGTLSSHGSYWVYQNTLRACTGKLISWRHLCSDRPVVKFVLVLSERLFHFTRRQLIHINDENKTKNAVEMPWFHLHFVLFNFFLCIWRHRSQQIFNLMLWLGRSTEKPECYVHDWF